MSPAIALSIIAASASLLAGVVSAFISRQSSQRSPSPAYWHSRKAEIKATGKAIVASVDLNTRSVRLLKTLFGASAVYFFICMASIFFMDTAQDGLAKKITTAATFILAGISAVLLFFAILLAYRSVRSRQDLLEQQVEEFRKLVRH